MDSYLKMTSTKYHIWSPGHYELTHYPLVMSYVDKDIDQHSLLPSHYMYQCWLEIISIHPFTELHKLYRQKLFTKDIYIY